MREWIRLLRRLWRILRAGARGAARPALGAIRLAAASTRSSTSTTWRLRAVAKRSLVASSPIAASIVSLCSIGKKHSATVVIRSCSGSTDGAGRGGSERTNRGQPVRDGDGVARPGAEPAAAVERLAPHQADQRGALAQEVDVAVDQQLERRAQLAGRARARSAAARRERLEAALALGEQALEHRRVEAAPCRRRSSAGSAAETPARRPISPRLARS